MFKFIFLFLVSLNAAAYDFDYWTDADKTREAVYIAVTTIDWLQTRNIARHNCTNTTTGSHDCYESGPASMFIGSNPSVGQVNSYFSSLILAHIGAVTVMHKNYRAAFQITTIAYEFSFVRGNYQIGISAKY